MSARHSAAHVRPSHHQAASVQNPFTGNVYVTDEKRRGHCSTVFRETHLASAVDQPPETRQLREALEVPRKTQVRAGKNRGGWEPDCTCARMRGDVFRASIQRIALAMTWQIGISARRCRT